MRRKGRAVSPGASQEASDHFLSGAPSERKTTRRNRHWASCLACHNNGPETQNKEILTIMENTSKKPALKKAYNKPRLVAKNAPQGSFAAGCPASGRSGSQECQQCERSG
jgi:hypothetical protein